jgi:predicted O-methyltransferase YrrM
MCGNYKGCKSLKVYINKNILKYNFINSFMNTYYKVADEIEGWFEYKILTPVLLEINKHQNQGNILEIGVLFGKSLIPLLTLLKDKEMAVAVDIYHKYRTKKIEEDQKIQKLKENIRKVFTNDNIFDRLKIVRENSSELNHQDYMNYSDNQKYRLISIDGSHNKNDVFIDIINSTKIITPDGLMIIDDYGQRNWPGVKAAVDKFLENSNEFRPIYLHFRGNKLILCHINYYDKYINIFKNFEDNYAIKYEKLCWDQQVWKK